MLTQRFRLFGLLIVLACIIATGAFCYTVIFSEPDNARCYPISYPTGDRPKAKSYSVRHFTTTDSIETVRNFYTQVMSPTSSYQEGKWLEYQFGDGSILYECHSILNSYEAERGCVYVKESDNSTTIETVWLYSETAAPFCQDSIKYLPWPPEN
jgi:hypothetical protein